MPRLSARHAALPPTPIIRPPPPPNLSACGSSRVARDPRDDLGCWPLRAGQAPSGQMAAPPSEKLALLDGLAHAQASEDHSSHRAQTDVQARANRRQAASDVNQERHPGHAHQRRRREPVSAPIFSEQVTTRATSGDQGDRRRVVHHHRQQPEPRRSQQSKRKAGAFNGALGRRHVDKCVPKSVVARTCTELVSKNSPYAQAIPTKNFCSTLVARGRKPDGTSSIARRRGKAFESDTQYIATCARPPISRRSAMLRKVQVETAKRQFSMNRIKECPLPSTLAASGQQAVSKDAAFKGLHVICLPYPCSHVRGHNSKAPASRSKSSKHLNTQ
eukprot:6213233-Pleurochrysis_carterae.AAC.2